MNLISKEEIAEEKARLLKALEQCGDDKRYKLARSYVEAQKRYVDTIEALQQDNEQLRAQAAVMREALKQDRIDFEVIEKITKYPCKYAYKDIDKVLSLDAGKGYHNPADVEALAKAKEALDSVVWECANNDKIVDEATFYKVSEAIAAIDNLKEVPPDA